MLFTFEVSAPTNSYLEAQCKPAVGPLDMSEEERGVMGGVLSEGLVGDRTSGVKITLKVDIHTATWQELG